MVAWFPAIVNHVVSSGGPPASDFGQAGRSFSAYSRSTRFPFFQIRKSSKIWESFFESCPRLPVAAVANDEKSA